MAAGKGTRMKSQLPKVLHRLGGRPLLQHVLATAAALKAERTLVITGHGADRWRPPSPPAAPAACARCRSWAPATPCSRWCRCCPTTPGSTTLILNGDVPLIRRAPRRAGRGLRRHPSWRC
jgi:bifunctional UDP-N-acetylglucosamine pyrophosphorylase/glucosamine-1-phosphate N-acetyltransferase